MSTVIGLADHCNGMSPALRNASGVLQAEIWAAINKAVEAGMPAGLTVGHLEFIKAAIIHQQFQCAESGK